jgi:hypothetical protein
MPTFLLSVITPTDSTPPAPDELDAIMSRVAEVRRDLETSGSWVFSGGLAGPGTALRAVRQTTGEVIVVDGPFVEGKEYVGGLTLLTADDLDGALGWAKRLAAVIGLPIDVRAVLG